MKRCRNGEVWPKMVDKWLVSPRLQIQEGLCLADVLLTFLELFLHLGTMIRLDFHDRWASLRNAGTNSPCNKPPDIVLDSRQRRWPEQEKPIKQIHLHSKFQPPVPQARLRNSRLNSYNGEIDCNCAESELRLSSSQVWRLVSNQQVQWHAQRADIIVLSTDSQS